MALHDSRTCIPKNNSVEMSSSCLFSIYLANISESIEHQAPNFFTARIFICVATYVRDRQNAPGCRDLERDCCMRAGAKSLLGLVYSEILHEDLDIVFAPWKQGNISDGQLSLDARRMVKPRVNRLHNWKKPSLPSPERFHSTAYINSAGSKDSESRRTSEFSSK